MSPAGNDTAELLDAVAAFVRRFIVLFSDRQADAVALWVLHTHAIEAASTTAYLAVLSPEKRSGKSRLLELLAALAARAEHVANVSEAALFRLIDHRRPTLLVDEVDALFGSNGERTEALRGVLNAGNRRGAVVYRCDGPRSELRAFQTFGAKVLAGIDTGRLPDTIVDRSIPIRLERKRPGDRVERLLWHDIEADATAIHDWAADWGSRFDDQLSVARPELPDQLDDRAAEGWWPLLAIADHAGGDWPARARAAAVELSSGDERDDQSRGVQLLTDLCSVFDGQLAMHTDDLLFALNRLEESQWGAWHDGAGMRPRDLGRLLRPYGVRSRSVRVGDRAAKGYHREQLEGPWSRYVLEKGSQGSQGSQPALHHEPNVTHVTDVTYVHGPGSQLDLTGDGGEPS